MSIYGTSLEPTNIRFPFCDQICLLHSVTEFIQLNFDQKVIICHSVNKLNEQNINPHRAYNGSLQGIQVGITVYNCLIDNAGTQTAVR